MNQQPPREASGGASRDGLAAVAIVLLAVALIAVVISKLV